MNQAAITEAGQRIARDAMRDTVDRDQRDVLSPFDRDILGPLRVRLQVPIRDPVELKAHLRLIIAAVTELAASLDHLPQKDRQALFMAKGALQRLNGKLNTKR